jgi:hypothetical protein
VCEPSFVGKYKRKENEEEAKVEERIKVKRSTV